MMTVTVNVWYSNSGITLPVLREYEIDGLTDENRIDLIAEAVSKDSRFTGKSDVTWQQVNR